MSDDSCTCGCTTTPATETKDQCGCGCAGGAANEPKEEVPA